MLPRIYIYINKENLETKNDVEIPQTSTETPVGLMLHNYSLDESTQWLFNGMFAAFPFFKLHPVL